MKPYAENFSESSAPASWLGIPQGSLSLKIRFAIHSSLPTAWRKQGQSTNFPDQLIKAKSEASI
jgi:hypothetical protein